MSVQKLLSKWREDPETAPNLSVWRTTTPRSADLNHFPADLPPVLADALSAHGINSLYSHQLLAWDSARRGENIVLATGTASGKTLGYNLPVLAALLNDQDTRALYLFPTKALAQDQLTALESFQSSIDTLRSAIYDGDTPASHRSAIRKNANIIFSNPDMLHTGVLPHHTNWGYFFRNLRFVIVDEMHTYRGVFGSHVANVIRRLKRVANYYGSNPQFILTSATIGNPQELAQRLIEAPVTLVDGDGSPRGERHFLVFNPPVIDPSLGIRKSSTQESIRLAQDLLEENVQTVVFARSRRSVEILLTYLQGNMELVDRETALSNPPAPPSPIRGYRSGYLPSQRREIEKGLRDGSIRLVVATNALELGIDIGGLEAALLVGYPGTIASTWQQAGRAGRGNDPAMAVLIATANPLDQFLAHHPDYFFARSPEQALVNPDHLLILLNHLRCSAFELPFKPGEGFGGLTAEKLKEFLDFLVDSHELHFSNGNYFWMAEAYPAAEVSLRSASPENVLLHVEDGSARHILGEVDLSSAAWMVHPRAIYLHEGQQYFVQDLNLSRNIATLIPVALDYYTEPLRQTELNLMSTLESTPCLAPLGTGEACTKGFGDLQVTTHVTGFRKRAWQGGDNLGEEPLDLPPTELQTTGYWLTLSDQTIEALRATGNWTNDPNDYGPGWNRLRDSVRNRDGYRCQVCGSIESEIRQHDVHHKIPFRQFRSIVEANRMDNLVTLCPTCHHKAEAALHMKSGLAGLATVLGQLAPLFLMCDAGDLGIYTDGASTVFSNPSIFLFDQVPAGIGFSQKLFEIHSELLRRALELVEECECEDGCPSCVGPAGENGVGGKQEALAILKLIVT
ncbi:MAG: DEAD/DEAH box helicase [Anaerolineales bacterium]|jgi:DEAD/DEAH box helicase domain-containing protein